MYRSRLFIYAVVLIIMGIIIIILSIFGNIKRQSNINDFLYNKRLDDRSLNLEHRNRIINFFYDVYIVDGAIYKGQHSGVENDYIIYIFKIKKNIFLSYLFGFIFLAVSIPFIYNKNNNPFLTYIFHFSCFKLSIFKNNIKIKINHFFIIYLYTLLVTYSLFSIYNERIENDIICILLSTVAYFVLISILYLSIKRVYISFYKRYGSIFIFSVQIIFSSLFISFYIKSNALSSFVDIPVLIISYFVSLTILLVAYLYTLIKKKDKSYKKVMEGNIL